MLDDFELFIPGVGVTGFTQSYNLPYGQSVIISSGVPESGVAAEPALRTYLDVIVLFDNNGPVSIETSGGSFPIESGWNSLFSTFSGDFSTDYSGVLFGAGTSGFRHAIWKSTYNKGTVDEFYSGGYYVYSTGLLELEAPPEA